ncbi:MAG: 50S ribosomal protein L11 methyltransferase [Pelagimonas sp.]|uniref:50S ribosomal protein L11 methyltransferase n=1 Tax=Pelagimonas sp. TaxID=2073170 RepID=UPI003D6AF94B
MGRDFQPQTTPEADDLVRFAKSEPLTDGGIQTSQLLTQALSLAPHHHEARVLLERVHQMFVPRWHFPMLADQVRNRAYAQAITDKVKPGDIVLDIGCGAGLTAMLAARAGAKHVYTCEQQPLIAQAATRVIAENGLSDRITVIPKWSHNIIIGADMPEPADVVISEIVDTLLLGEGALATLKHAMSLLAKPNARAIPESGALLAQPVESERLVDLWQPQVAEGFDLSAFHHFASVAQITANEFDACKLRQLGPPTDLFDFDFTNPDITPARTTAELVCQEDGTIHAVLVSFKMELSPGIFLTNGMESGGHWGRTAFLLDTPKPAQCGDLLEVIAQHDASTLSLTATKAKPQLKEISLEPDWTVVPAQYQPQDGHALPPGLPH